jgi:hypothetical protein
MSAEIESIDKDPLIPIVKVGEDSDIAEELIGADRNIVDSTIIAHIEEDKYI